MSSKPDSAAPAGESLANRRWLIGLGITVVFGLFGAVMAVLSYSERARPSGAPAAAPASPAAAAPAAPAGPAPKGRGKGRGND